MTIGIQSNQRKKPRFSLASISDDGDASEDTQENSREEKFSILDREGQHDTNESRRKRMKKALSDQKNIFKDSMQGGGDYVVSHNPFKRYISPQREANIISVVKRSLQDVGITQGVHKKQKRSTVFVPVINDSVSSMALFRRPKILGMKKFFSTWKDKERKERIEHRKKQYVIEKWRAYVIDSNFIVITDGLEKFNAAIHALNRLDEIGYRRSKQQIEFHTAFLGSMVQQIFGADLNKYLNEILEALGLKELNKDIAVCCPRRFGKSTSVALFAAAMIFTQGDIDFVIYSIAMRTSRMLTARIYQMVVGLAGGTHVITTSNQEILTISSISGGSSTVYSYPAASAISIP